MKHLVFVVIDKHTVIDELISILIKEGFNGNVIPSNSFKHTLDNEGEQPFVLNLFHIEHKKLENSTTLTIVVEDHEVKKVTDIIRDVTKKFTLCHGGMFYLPIESFEGSF